MLTTILLTLNISAQRKIKQDKFFYVIYLKSKFLKLQVLKVLVPSFP